MYASIFARVSDKWRPLMIISIPVTKNKNSKLVL
jgi:hypothetical protein